MLGNPLRDRMGLLDTFHERRTDDLVLFQPDQLWHITRRSEDLFDSGVAEHRAQVSIKRAWRPAPLDMPETGDPGVLPKSFLDGLFDVLGCDGVAMTVLGTFCDDDDVESPTDRTACLERIDHRVFPVVLLGRILRNQDPVSTGRDRAHQRQIATVAAHDFDDKGSLVAGCGAVDRIDRFSDPVQSSVGADGHIGPEHVVVDRADQANQCETTVRLGHVLFDLTFRDEILQVTPPLFSKEIGASEAAIATDDHECIDAQFDQVLGRLAATLGSPERVAAGGSEHRATLVEDATDRLGSRRGDQLATVYESLKALVDRIHLEVGGESGTDDSTNRGVHPGGITTAGKHGEALGSLGGSEHVDLLAVSMRIVRGSWNTVGIIWHK